MNVLTLLGERWAASANRCVVVVDGVWSELLLALANSCLICCVACCTWADVCAGFDKNAVVVRNCWAGLLLVGVVVVIVFCGSLSK